MSAAFQDEQWSFCNALWRCLDDIPAATLTAFYRVQIVIQLQKFAEAVKRIKGAVGSVNDKKAPAAAKPQRQERLQQRHRCLAGTSPASSAQTSLTSTPLWEVSLATLQQTSASIHL